MSGPVLHSPECVKGEFSDVCPSGCVARARGHAPLDASSRETTGEALASFGPFIRRTQRSRHAPVYTACEAAVQAVVRASLVGLRLCSFSGGCFSADKEQARCES